MATLPEAHEKLLESLGYQPMDNDSDRARFRNEQADAEVEIVEIGGQYHFDFAGFDMLGGRTVMDDLILNEEVLTRMTEESRAGRQLAESSAGPP